MGFLFLLLIAAGTFAVCASLSFTAVSIVKAIERRGPKQYSFSRPAEPVNFTIADGMAYEAQASVDGDAASDSFKKG